MKDFAKKILADVPEGKEFFLHHNNHRRYLKNILDLKAELELMNAEEYASHVSETKNDFSIWVNDAVGDEKLAHDIVSASTKEEMIVLIKSRIEFAVSIIEKENKKLIEDEEKVLKEVSAKKKNTVSLNHQISHLEKDVKKMSQNIDLENKLVNSKDDSQIPSLHASSHLSLNARIVEFIFGLAVGFVLGLIIARAFIGL